MRREINVNIFDEYTDTSTKLYTIKELPDDIMEKKNLKIEIVNAHILHHHTDSSIDQLNKRGRSLLTTEPQDTTAEETVVKTLVQFPHRSLDNGTQDDNNITLDETVTEGTIDGVIYRVTASSIYPGYSPWNLFAGAWGSESPPANWRSNAGTYASDGSYIGTNSLGGISGEWVAIELPFAISINQFKFKNSGDIITRAAAISLMGSVDGQTWTLIDSRSNLDFSYESRHGDYTNKPDYKHYALVFESTNGSNTEGWVGFNEWYLLGFADLKTLQTESITNTNTSTTHNVTIELPNGLPIGQLDDLTNIVDINGLIYEGYSSSNTASWNIWNVFFGYGPQTESEPNAWLSDENLYTQANDGGYIGGSSLAEFSGEWIKMKLPFPINYRSSSVKTGTKNGRASKTILILGSNDDTTWTQLDTHSFTNYNECAELYTDPSIDKTYQYFAIVTTTILGGSLGRVGLNEWRIRGEKSIIIP